MHEHNCFITLTYDDKHLPLDGSLNKAHFQKFMKRLRDRIFPKKIRFYHCGEYGPKYSRPHYHSLIFGYDFPDKKLWSLTTGKNRLYRSTELESLWQKGYTTIGSMTKASAGYCARYSIKKLRGPALSVRDPETDLLPYQRINDQGEIVDLQPEYATMSTGRKTGQGIGGSWYEKYKDDVFPDDFVVHEGKRVRTPAYYRKLLEQSDPEISAELRAVRKEHSSLHKLDQTDARLRVREKVKTAQATRLTRNYEDGTSAL